MAPEIRSVADNFLIISTAMFFIAVVAGIVSFIIMFLWNWLAVMLFGLPEINLFHAFGIFISLSIIRVLLFGR